MGTVHKASLVDPALHSPPLLEMLNDNLTRMVIDHLIRVTIDVVDFAMIRPSTSYQTTKRPRLRNTAAFARFVTFVITRSQTDLPTLLVALVYMDRAKPHLAINFEHWACERMFLGALIVASKYLHDATLKNEHWGMCTGIFGTADIGRVEREFLGVLDWKLSVQESDILAYYDVICPRTILLTSPRHDLHKNNLLGNNLRSKAPQSAKRRRSPDIEQVSSESDDSCTTAPSPQTPFEMVTCPYSPVKSPGVLFSEEQKPCKRPRSTEGPQSFPIIPRTPLPPRRGSISNPFLVLRSISIHMHWPTSDKKAVVLPQIQC